MSSPLHDKLRAELATVTWRDLAPHHKRGGLVLVDPGLDLVEVAVAVANDDAPAVSAWIGSGQLAHATDEQAALWTDSGQAFTFLIVQPYVLAAVALDA